MRLQHAVITLAVLAVTMVSLIGAARVTSAEPREGVEAVVVPVAVTRAAVPEVEMKDQAAMLLVGTALIGLAAAVRRAA